MEPALSNTDGQAAPSDETIFLDWFAVTFKAPVVMSRVELGDISYHRASAIQESAAFPFVSTGRGQTTISAAVKAASEFIERKLLSELHRSNSPAEFGSCTIAPTGDLIVTPEFAPPPPLPRCLYTSNGWAVHSSKEGAIRGGLIELIERHSLILSYLRSQWKGFQLINEMKIKEYRFLSCLARSRVAGHSAGVILGIVPTTGGISLGCMADRTTNILTSTKWQHAFFESYDNIETFDPSDQFPEKSLEAIGHEYLMEKFTHCSMLTESNEFSEDDIGPSTFELYDLKNLLGCPVPLFAAHVTSPDLIPLFFPQTLDAEGAKWLKCRLRRYGDLELPARMPIL